MSLGQKLAQLRGDKSLSQLHRETQINLGYLGRIERDEQLPSREVLEALASALGVDAEVLVDERDMTELQQRLGYDADAAQLIVRLRRTVRGMGGRDRERLLARLHEQLERHEGSR